MNDNEWLINFDLKKYEWVFSLQNGSLCCVVPEMTWQIYISTIFGAILNTNYFFW